MTNRTGAPNPEVTRQERDSLGPVEVPADRYWGAQTQRSLENFDIGRNRFVWDRPLIRALGLVKKAAVLANAELGALALDAEIVDALVRAATEVSEGQLDAHFPLVVFQTGSGTHTNMNANEVIANRAEELLGGRAGDYRMVHPNDHVNQGQSSNDVFPTVVHVAASLDLRERLLPAITGLHQTLTDRAAEFDSVVMIGRTHLQDATPIRLGQVVGGWAAQVAAGYGELDRAGAGLAELAIGGTAVGTGLNAHPRFGDVVAARLGAETGIAFRPAGNLVAAVSGREALVGFSAALRGLAGSLLKIANDIRWLASGPRAGIGELTLPANEPGSSIMPGKVNPTQCEALTMVCARVLGNDATVAFAGSQGTFQLNVYTPVIADAVFESIRVLADACTSFRWNCLVGLEPDRRQIAAHLADSLMLVTALTPHIGYDKAAAIAQRAHQDQVSLRAAAIATGLVAAEDFDRWVIPESMA